MFVIFTVITGIIYPLAVTGIAQVVFPSQANGSLIVIGGKTYGSELIGQQFDDPKYFLGTHLGHRFFPVQRLQCRDTHWFFRFELWAAKPRSQGNGTERIDKLKAADPGNNLPIPVDLVTASASGLDPHISVAAAYYQVHRVAQGRGLSDEAVQALVEQYTYGRQFGFLGEPRVNVLELNLALDGLK